MYIELRAINKFGNGGSEYELPSEIIRYLEFKDSVIFLLNANGLQNHIVSVKYRTIDPHAYYIAWEFKYQTSFSSFTKSLYGNQERIRIQTYDDAIFIIDTDDGHIVFHGPTHG
ncbi:hypothetical protein FACS1894182_13400 [Bacteroidia bacterium]|nr:hypothetical protein FACS1894182_13400 [Bacteroidia bacterium]